jgi:molybdopterin-containing oxidoreductase family membrane subunit
MVVSGVIAYFIQFEHGLVVTNMRDQVSWGFYIGNFAFLVGVAAAAVTLVIPAYIYHWKPIKEVVVLGEVLAVAALVMCTLFVTVDVGQPLRLWHLMPIIGRLNWPSSILSWDVIVLNLYFLLNVSIVSYILYCTFTGTKYNNKYLLLLVFSSIPGAVSIHTVTAFLFNVLPARPFWNTAILAPRFLITAFCSGPAIMLIVFQILRKTTKFKVSNEALWKIAELMAYAMGFNLVLLLAEMVKEFYSATEHVIHAKYYFFGVGEHSPLVKYAWTSVVTSVAAFLLFLTPKTRENIYTMNLGCVLIFIGVYIEKGIGLILPGMTPGTLGEIFPYEPSLMEILIAGGIWGLGGLIFTLLSRLAINILLGEFTIKNLQKGQKA